MIRALPAQGPAPTAFREAACAALRVSRSRARAECDALVTIFEEELPDGRRLLVLDLLASAGTPEAQATIRHLLSLAVAREEQRAFATFVQRLGFIERPDGATLRFLLAIYAETRAASDEVHAAAAYALGSAAGRAHVWGLDEPAQCVAEVLRRDLFAATTAADKCTLLAALGNAGLDSDVATIVRFVDDPEVPVRNAAAHALRKMHTPEAKGWLLALLGGGDPVVAESALSALFEHSFAEGEIVRLAELVLAGRTALALDRRILRLIVTQRLADAGRPVKQAVQLLLVRIDAGSTRMKRDEASGIQPSISEAAASYVPPPVSEQMIRSVTPSSIARGSASAALRACLVEPVVIPPLVPLPRLGDLREPVPRASRGLTEREDEEASEPVREIRTNSAFIVEAPVVPKAVIR